MNVPYGTHVPGESDWESGYWRVDRFETNDALDSAEYFMLSDPYVPLRNTLLWCLPQPASRRGKHSIREEET